MSPGKLRLSLRPLTEVVDSSRPELGVMTFMHWRGGFRGESFAKCRRSDGSHALVRDRNLLTASESRRRATMAKNGTSRSWAKQTVANSDPAYRKLLMERLNLTEAELEEALKD